MNEHGEPAPGPPPHAVPDVRLVCREAQALAGAVGGPLRQLRVSAGACEVVIEWEPPARTLPGGGAHDDAGGGAGTEDPSACAVTAPLVGTFYRRPAPDEPPFVEEGDRVESGQIVAVIEAMKLMNRVEADRSGTVGRILVEDGTMVAFGEPLLTVVEDEE